MTLTQDALMFILALCGSECEIVAERIEPPAMTFCVRARQAKMAHNYDNYYRLHVECDTHPKDNCRIKRAVLLERGCTEGR